MKGLSRRRFFGNSLSLVLDSSRGRSELLLILLRMVATEEKFKTICHDCSDICLSAATIASICGIERSGLEDDVLCHWAFLSDSNQRTTGRGTSNHLRLIPRRPKYFYFPSGVSFLIKTDKFSASPARDTPMNKTQRYPSRP